MELEPDLEQCMKDWTDLSNEYAVILLNYKGLKIEF